MALDPQPLLRIENLSKVFNTKIGEVKACSNINLEVMHGEFVCIVGPSGCGKSTLLRMIADLDIPTDGTLDINHNGRDQPCEIRMVFQEQGLYPWMSVADNIAFTLAGNPVADSQRINEIVNEYLAAVGLSGFETLYPYQLSGGMRQRVSIARAFANQPELLLMDEPFVFLDYQTRNNLQSLLMEMWEKSRQTVIFVTHDIEEAVLLADTVYIMSAHPGTVLQSFTIDLPRPRDRFALLTNQVYMHCVAKIAEHIKPEFQAELRR